MKEKEEQSSRGIIGLILIILSYILLIWYGLWIYEPLLPSFMLPSFPDPSYRLILPSTLIGVIVVWLAFVWVMNRLAEKND